ncbi:MAG TPA: patatin-like phospholipase family protein [Bryobacteraceae bacterium]|nr:patatin-like phospholipase family protein [Bryobacteraceae bacterium]
MPCALVLSAGGLFAAYQAGAWKALADRFQPDLVVGASAGALNGWAIAGGCSTGELIEEWMSPAAAGLIQTRVTILPWRGWFDPAPLARHVQEMFARFPPRVPYALTMVEVPRLRRVRVPGEQVTPAHLMASCAIPCGYPPVRLNGRFYVDGGLLDVVPLWAAVEMGATRVIAVNALPRMPSATLRTAVRLVRAVGPAPARFPDLEVTEIRPPAPLGALRDSIVWKESNIRRWIEQGEEDAGTALRGGASAGNPGTDCSVHAATQNARRLGTE